GPTRTSGWLQDRRSAAEPIVPSGATRVRPGWGAWLFRQAVGGGMAGRTIAIGDIHGCRDALAALLDAIAPGPQDTLVTLGDHIDAGPDSRGVLDLLLALSGRCRLVPLLGDHEDMLAAALGDTTALRRWLACGGTQTLRSYGWARGGPRRAL